jgi:aminobenzoyl-glutamate transport protein
VLAAKSLLSTENLRLLLTDTAKTFTSFPPLGLVLVVMLGAGVAERTGLLPAVMRQMVGDQPTAAARPAVILVGLLSNHASDAGFIVLPPLAGVAFAAAGRHPVAGIACAYAAVIGAFAGNPTPGQFEALILGLSEPAAKLIDPAWTANMVGNWFFTATMGTAFLFAGWWLTDKVVEPRLGPWRADASGLAATPAPLTVAEHAGLRRAGVVALGVVALWTALVLLPGSPLQDDAAAGPQRWTPLFRSLIAGFFLLFLASGWAYGAATGAVRSGADVVRMSTESIAAMAPYIVLAFVAAHFIAMFNWSNLGAITAINGAEALRRSGLPLFVLLPAVTVLAGSLDLVIASASAKWAALGPVVVPMLMLLGVSPEMTTAAYRAGDSSLVIASPMNAYFILLLGFTRRWLPGFGVGGMIAALLPYALAFFAIGIAIVTLFAVLELPTGPASAFSYAVPARAGA